MKSSKKLLFFTFFFAQRAYNFFVLKNDLKDERIATQQLMPKAQKAGIKKEIFIVRAANLWASPVVSLTSTF